VVLKLTCGVDALAKIESDLKKANPELEITNDNLLRSPPNLQYSLSLNYYGLDYREINYDIIPYDSFY